MSKQLIKQIEYLVSRGFWGRNSKDVLFTFISVSDAREFEMVVKELLKEAKPKPRKSTAEPESVDTFFSQGTGGGNRVIRSSKPMT